MNKEIKCLDCCHCVQCNFTGEFECEREIPEFPEKCDEYEKCYKGERANS